MDSSRSISSTMASRSASRNEMTRASGFDIVHHRLGSRKRRLLRELHRILHLRPDLVVDGLDLLRVRDPEALDALRQDENRIALHPLLDLFLRAVLGRIGNRVA